MNRFSITILVVFLVAVSFWQIAEAQQPQSSCDRVLSAHNQDGVVKVNVLRIGGRVYPLTFPGANPADVCYKKAHIAYCDVIGYTAPGCMRPKVR